MKINQTAVVNGVKSTGLSLVGAMGAHAVVSFAQEKLPEPVGKFAPEAVLLGSVVAGAVAKNPMAKSVAVGAGVYSGIRTANKYIPEALKLGIAGKFIPSLNGTEDEDLMLLQGTGDYYTEEFLEDAEYASEFDHDQSFDEELSEIQGIEGTEGFEGGNQSVLSLLQ